MSLKLTNSLSRRKEVFIPLKNRQVSIYCCGVTVYDLCHLGHARSYINWDVLRRYLIWQGYEVTFIQNFTDIDDKIIKRSIEENCSTEEVSERNINEFHLDMDSIGILRPDRMPRATKCLQQINNLISELIRKGSAYSVDGDVYFAVLKHKGYGKLSRRELLDQQQNADGRITTEEENKKSHPFDFALWKKAKKGETSFSSPWGEGRPGWHIECSAMVREELGETIDIHLGGSDLIFPHHENEIAQSEAATGQELARYWLHNGMVNVGGQKMSKSLGNFTTIRSLLKKGISAMTLRLFVLQANYRKPLDFTEDSLKSAATGWERLNIALLLGKTSNIFNNKIKTKNIRNESNKTHINENNLNREKQRFIDLMNDDLNTSGALSVLFELAKPLRAMANQINLNNFSNLTEIDQNKMYQRWCLLVELSNTLGLKAEVNKKKTSPDEYINESSIQSLIKARALAKSNKDFAKADLIRDDLKKKNINLIDKPDGSTEWIRN